MINLVKTDEGAYLTFKTDGTLYAIPFEYRWRRIGTYDCPQLCEGCGFLTNTISQHASSRASIACKARRLLYLLTYQWAIEHCLQEERGTLIRLRAEGLTLVLLDYTTNGSIQVEGEPLSHAMLLKHYVDARWTLDGIAPYLPHLFEDMQGEKAWPGKASVTQE